MIRKIAAISFIFVCTTIGWMILAGTVVYRTDGTDRDLKSSVGRLWGTSQLQQEPKAFVFTEGRSSEERSTNLEGSAIDVKLDLEHRKKGLLWYATYAVDFNGTYKVANPTDKKSQMAFIFTLPSMNAIYDNFELYIGEEHLENVEIVSGSVKLNFELEANQQKEIHVLYGSQGMDRWDYDFGQNVKQVKDFSLTVTTNFDQIDFPDEAISPTVKEKIADGWKLNWEYKNLLTAVRIGVAMPVKLNPGPWVSRVTTMAPVSLFLYFFLLFIITSIKRIKLHPMNYFFIGTSFFSFHLLMAYLVDHISIHAAFWICSAVSLFLVISYMRLVVGLRFAFVEIAISQLVYLVFFSYTFFMKGYTGLAITILCICTLFTVMQATGKVDWAEAFKKPELLAKEKK